MQTASVLVGSTLSHRKASTAGSWSDAGKGEKQTIFPPSLGDGDLVQLFMLRVCSIPKREERGKDFWEACQVGGRGEVWNLMNAHQFQERKIPTCVKSIKAYHCNNYYIPLAKLAYCSPSTCIVRTTGTWFANTRVSETTTIWLANTHISESCRDGCNLIGWQLPLVWWHKFKTPSSCLREGTS